MFNGKETILHAWKREVRVNAYLRHITEFLLKNTSPRADVKEHRGNRNTPILGQVLRQGTTLPGQQTIKPSMNAPVLVRMSGTVLVFALKSAATYRATWAVNVSR